MAEYLPLLIVGAVIGLFTLIFLVAYRILKKKTQAQTSERHMTDREIIARLARYATPYKKDFLLVFVIMLISIAYDVVSPLLVAQIQGTIKGRFALQLMELGSLVTLVTNFPTGIWFSWAWESCSMWVKVSKRSWDRIFWPVFCKIMAWK